MSESLAASRMFDNSSFMKPSVVARIIIYFLAAMSPEQETRHSLLEKQLIKTWDGDRAGDGNMDSALCDHCHEETLFSNLRIKLQHFENKI